MIAIHNGVGGFHPLWREYCEKNRIAFKSVDCYANNLIDQIHDCTMLYWHFSQSDARDIILSKKIMLALKHARIGFFPNFETAWHFDDKVAQKYLMESLQIDFIPSYTFVQKEDAFNWIETTTFPKVFKLKGGAGSANVSLVPSKSKAKKLVKKAFTKGFSPYDGWGSFKDVFVKFLNRKSNINALLRSFYRVVFPPQFVKSMGREYGYVYFQDFIPNNTSDYRVIVIADKAFAIRRGVRKGDFRASGSGYIEYSKELFSNSLIEQAFGIATKLRSQCVALDFVVNNEGKYMLVEISYGFAPHGYVKCEGYWDKGLNWFPGEINPYGWMIELSQVKE